MHGELLHPIDRAPLARLVIDQVMVLIAGGDLEAGDRLPSEKEMMNQLGISRPSIREALRALQALGMIEIRPGQGSYVNSIGFDMVVNEELVSLLLRSDELSEIMDARAVLEAEIARLAALRATQESLKLLEELLDVFERTVQRGESVFELAWRFHTRLAEAAGNTVMAKLLGILHSMIKGAEAEIYDAYFDKESELLAHRKLLEVVEARDGEYASRAMVEHLDETRRIIDAALGRDATPETAGSIHPESRGCQDRQMANESRVD